LDAGNSKLGTGFRFADRSKITVRYETHELKFALIGNNE
jgi:hypothetical protein